MPEADDAALLRHTLATLAYRAAKVLRDAPNGFADYRAAPATRTPGKILAHMGDLFDWAVGLADGRHFGTTRRLFPGMTRQPDSSRRWKLSIDGWPPAFRFPAAPASCFQGRLPMG